MSHTPVHVASGPADLTLPVAPDAAGSAPDRLRLLDDPAEWSAFGQPLPAQGANCWESHVVVQGMHCAACALTIEDALGRVPGVVSARVSAASHRARVVWQADRVAPSAWMAAVAQAGYQALPARDALAREMRRKEQRRALWRWLVAGLCMMQVMMYATPAYVAGPGEMTDDMLQLLRWASWVLSVPVVLFSCGPFFSNAWRDLTQRRISMDLPVSLGMVITFAVSTAGTFDPQGIFGAEVYFDSLTMFVFFLLTGRWLETRLQDRTAGALEALMNRLPDSVERQTRDGSFEVVAARRLIVGDVVRVKPGEAFAADGHLLDGQTLVDEALLTGESRALPRTVGDTVIAGGHNLSATVLMCVDQVGAQTRFADIVRLMEAASTSKPRLAVLADRMARPFLWAVLVASALAAAWWWPTNPAQAMMVAVAVLVVTCPCALSLATPAAMLASAGALARRGLLVRHLQAIEHLAGVDTVVFDKTGTLTGAWLGLTGQRCRSGVAPEAALALAAQLARHSLHPVSRALCRAAEAGPVGEAHEVCELPGQGLSGVVADGRRLRLGSAKFCGLENTAAPAPGQGQMQTHLVDELGWLATFDWQETLRPDAQQTVQALSTLGVQVQLLSGDHPDAVERVARQLGIATYRGACSPADKLSALQLAQSQGHKVAMVGDGLNDGPVLAGAHVSFAFGNAVPLAQARADLVVLGDRLMEVAAAVLLARRTLKIVRQNLVWAAAYNAVCVPLAVVGWLPAWLAGLGMALSSLLVVLNALRLSSPLQPKEAS